MLSDRVSTGICGLFMVTTILITVQIVSGLTSLL